jgi:hypothetical protein
MTGQAEIVSAAAWQAYASDIAWRQCPAQACGERMALGRLSTAANRQLK